MTRFFCPPSKHNEQQQPQVACRPWFPALVVIIGAAFSLGPTSVTIGPVADINGDGIFGDDITGSLPGSAHPGVQSLVTATGVSTLLQSGSLGVEASSAIAISDPVTWSSNSTLILFATAGTVTIAPSASISAASGSLGVAGTSISQGGPLIIGGSAQFLASSGNLSLTNSANAFSGTVDLNAAQNIAITNAVPLNLGSVSLSGGTLTASAPGITQTQQITGASLATFNAGAAPITLANPFNDFVEIALSNSGLNTVVVTDSVGSLLLGPVSVGQDLNLSTSGTVTQRFNAGLLVPGVLRIDSPGDVVLPNSTNSLNRVVLAASGSASMAAATSISFGDGTSGASGISHIAGSLSVSAGAGIIQTGRIIVGGSSTFNAISGSIALTNTMNDFGQLVTAQATGSGDIQIRDSNALTVAPNSGRDTTLTAAGNLTVVAAVTGRDLTTTTSAGGETFFAASVFSVGRNLRVTSAGPVSQSGPLFVSGTTQVTAANNPVTLDHAGNDFVGAVTFTGTASSSVAIRDANTLTIGSSTITGALTANAPLGVSFTGSIRAGSVNIASPVAFVTGNLTTTGNQQYTGTASLGGDFVLVGSSISFSSPISGNSRALTIDATGVSSFPSASDLTSLTKEGSGTLLLTGQSSYAGYTRISAGTVQIGMDDALPASSELRLVEGTLALGGRQQTMSSLTLLGDATIELGIGGSMAFGDSSGQVWSGSLTITEFGLGMSTLRFGTGPGSLTADQLALIRFADYGNAPGQIDPAGFVTPSAIPEPSTYAACVGGVVFSLAWWRRRAERKKSPPFVG